MEQTRDYTKQYLLYIGGVILAIFAVVVLFGRIELHNELERERLPHTLVGYMERSEDGASADSTLWKWPAWTEGFQCEPVEPDLLRALPDDGHIGIFADLVYYENRYERRSWFSGRLIKRASEYYYRPEGAIYAEVVYGERIAPEILPEELAAEDYNIYGFKGQ